MFEPTRRRDDKPVRIEDEARFLKSWVERPLVTGAVTPSGRMLARTMASYIDPTKPGPVIELGPGTGPVTEAIVRRGVDPHRLVLVEFNPDFCKLLHRRFPAATIVHGDAYGLGKTLRGVVHEEAAAVVSSLPLFTRPLPQRLTLLEAAFDLMHAGAPFIQFTYAVVPPIPKNATRYAVSASNRVWWNLPPARVWVYRRHTG
ncbi:phospholipid methyltransferase [Chelatococcus sp. SYSU_G07232]|uniref:Phospholipid methyltransferase n=1 Tax=Chelatococcus albus TaxID=3047466 RepID=A0ABT7AHS8_9HYPH|nr:phospholipid methyltransferase [Chelatococcus sp. SYSU_G07232]MDJ1158913.1 phospholipid methyltransferase [Chelatococcus sp. SYSU_G07232]